MIESLYIWSQIDCNRMSYHVWYWDILGMYKDFDSGIEGDVI